MSAADAAQRINRATPDDMRPLLADYAQPQRAELADLVGEQVKAGFPDQDRAWNPDVTATPLPTLFEVRTDRDGVKS